MCWPYLLHTFSYTAEGTVVSYPPTQTAPHPPGQSYQPSLPASELRFAPTCHRLAGSVPPPNPGQGALFYPEAL